MDEVGDYVDFYFTLPNYDSNLLKWHESSLQDTAVNLKIGLDLIEKIPADKFTQENLEEKLLSAISKENRGDVLWPLRVALSGKKDSPGPFEIMEALGKEESKRRIKNALEKIGLLDI